jgi:hypothetical protein
MINSETNGEIASPAPPTIDAPKNFLLLIIEASPLRLVDWSNGNAHRASL